MLKIMIDLLIEFTKNSNSLKIFFLRCFEGYVDRLCASTKLSVRECQNLALNTLINHINDKRILLNIDGQLNYEEKSKKTN